MTLKKCPKYWLSSTPRSNSCFLIPLQAALHFNAQPSTGVNVVVGAAHFLFYLTAGVSPVAAEATIDFYTQSNNGAD